MDASSFNPNTADETHSYYPPPDFDPAVDGILFFFFDCMILFNGHFLIGLHTPSFLNETDGPMMTFGEQEGFPFFFLAFVLFTCPLLLFRRRF